jgi:XTP/dITP diphosphohydrolase
MRQFREKTLLIATHNAGKLTEISSLLEGRGIEVVSAKSLGLDEPAETGSSFIENARIKAHFAAKETGLTALADDSGICVDALNGAPGIYTADLAETGNGRDFEMAMRRVWEELEAAAAPVPRKAKFCCTFVLAWPDGYDAVFEGVMPGSIVWPMRGQFGHGYDPFFEPGGYEQTFAEMPVGVKNQISHRADAFAKLLSGCFT